MLFKCAIMQNQIEEVSLWLKLCFVASIFRIGINLPVATARPNMARGCDHWHGRQMRRNMNIATVSKSFPCRAVDLLGRSWYHNWQVHNPVTFASKSCQDRKIAALKNASSSQGVWAPNWFVMKRHLLLFWRCSASFMSILKSWPCSYIKHRVFLILK